MDVEIDPTESWLKQIEGLTDEDIRNRIKMFEDNLRIMKS